MAAKGSEAISRPIQLFGQYLAWCESAFAVGLLATSSYTRGQEIIIWTMAIGLVAFVGVVGFLLIFLTVKQPWFLFNPSDYDPSVQSKLFGPGTPTVAVTAEQEPDIAG